MSQFLKQTTTIIIFFVCIVLSCKPTSFSTDAPTANDAIPNFSGHFGYGSNMGYYPPYTDMQLMDISSRINVNTLRPGLTESFLEQWGYDIRTDAFQHFGDLNMTNNVLFIGYPSKEHRDNTVYCGKDSSALFANMYEPIFDKGENGTPVNDKNYYALYVYKTVKKYGKNVKFYEIWNEPDYATTAKTEATPGSPGSWWTENPLPCEYTLHAPIQHYIRLLRISYEVIKSIDASANVCIGGIGIPSFLDVVLRQTDNPKDGSATSDYPLKGGAYFDVLSYHSYPHIDNSLRAYNNANQNFDQFRHSDRAVTGFLDRKTKMTDVLNKYGYNGSTFPQKHFIVTETNIPAKPIGEYIGSYEAQRNYVIKALVKAQQNDILQVYIYGLGEFQISATIHDEFDKMGLYAPLTNTVPYQMPPTECGYAFSTTAKTLSGFDADATETQKMQIPANMDGGAFKNKTTGEVRFVLWAKTSVDQSEKTQAVYNFPDTLNIPTVKRRDWDFSKTQKDSIVSTHNIILSGTPIFLIKN